MVVCSLCLTSNATDYIDLSQNKHKKSKLSSIIQTHLNLNIHSLHIVSNFVCIDCYFKLLEFQKYCQKINQTQKLLRKTVYKAICPRPTADAMESYSEQFAMEAKHSKDTLKHYDKIHKHCEQQFACPSMKIINTAMKRVKRKLIAPPREKLAIKAPPAVENKKDFSMLQIAQINADVDKLQLYVIERLRKGNNVPMPTLTRKIIHKLSSLNLGNNTKKTQVEQDYFKCEHCLEAFKHNKAIKDHKPTCDNCPLHNFIFPCRMQRKLPKRAKIEKPKPMFRLY